MIERDLSKYNNTWYNPGGNIVKRSLWYMTNVLFFINPICVSSRLKAGLLRLFGAKVGKKVVIKPGVNIKYPWFLKIGSHTWIGERAWIDNLAEVVIGDNVCISQGAIILCGNHDYRKPTFDLIVKGVTIEDGAWVGAWSTVCPGVTIHTHAVLCASSVAMTNLAPYTVNRGNPSLEVKKI